MIQDVAELQGNIDVDIVTDALAKSTQRVMGPQYMTAGMGDGGACHPRDNIALRYLAQNLNLGYDLFESIMLARDIQAENLAKKLVELSKEYDFPIVIHGKSYKPKVPYCDGSYSILIGYYCEQLGCKIRYIDPCTGDFFQPEKPCVFLLAHKSKVTYKYLNQEQKEDLYCEIPDQSIVVDPWRNYQNNKCKVIHYGNTRLNV